MIPFYLQVRCHISGNFVRISNRARDRFVLAKKRGEKLSMICNCCGASRHYHVNELKARPNGMLLIAAGLILGLGTPAVIVLQFLFFADITNVYLIAELAGLIMVPYLVYKAIKSTHESRVNYFNNKYYG